MSGALVIAGAILMHAAVTSPNDSEARDIEGFIGMVLLVVGLVTWAIT